MKVRSQSLVLAMTMFLSHQAKAQDVSSETACLFFFEMFTPRIADAQFLERPFKVLEVGTAQVETQLTVPRYKIILWPDGLAKSVSHSRSDLGLQAIAFEFSCLVDTKDNRVVTLSVGPGIRTGEPVSMEGDQVKNAVPAAPDTVSMLATPMQGLF